MKQGRAGVTRRVALSDRTWHLAFFSFLFFLKTHQIFPQNCASFTDSAMQLLPEGIYQRFWRYCCEILKHYFVSRLSPTCTDGKNTRQSQTKLLFMSQPSKSHIPMPMHAHTDALQQEPCAYSSKHSSRQWKRKGPNNCHLSIFIKNLP